MTTATKILNVNGTHVSTDCKIQMKSNPKRVGSKAYLRYEQYASSKTVGEYLENGGLPADLKWDQKKEFLQLLEKYDSKDNKVVKIAQ